MHTYVSFIILLYYALRELYMQNKDSSYTNLSFALGSNRTLLFNRSSKLALTPKDPVSPGGLATSHRFLKEGHHGVFASSKAQGMVE